MINLRSLLIRVRRLEQKTADALIEGPPVERMSLQDIQAEMIEGSSEFLKTPHREEAICWLRQVASTGLTEGLRNRALEALASVGQADASSTPASVP